MKRLFNYCVCSIANIYKKCGLMEDYIAQGYFLMFFAFTCITLSIVNIGLFQFGYRLNNEIIIVFSIPMIVEILFFRRIFPNCEQIFEQFEQKNDRLRWLKTAIVVLFLISALVLFIWSLYHFRIQK